MLLFFGHKRWVIIRNSVNFNFAWWQKYLYLLKVNMYIYILKYNIFSFFKSNICIWVTRKIINSRICNNAMCKHIGIVYPFSGSSPDFSGLSPDLSGPSPDLSGPWYIKSICFPIVIGVPRLYPPPTPFFFVAELPFFAASLNTSLLQGK